jgi:hypothetical protein
MPEANSTESNNSTSESTAPAQQGSGDNNANSNPGGNADNSGNAGQDGSPAAGAGDSGAAGHSRSSDTPPNFGEVLTAIAAMPEQIVRALKEANPAPQRPRNTSAGNDTQGQGNSSQTGTQTASRGSQGNDSQTPGKKTFADWWFGR